MASAARLVIHPLAGLKNNDRRVWSAATQRKRMAGALGSIVALCGWVAVGLLRPSPWRGLTLWLTVAGALVCFVGLLLFTRQVVRHAYISVSSDSVRYQSAFGSPAVVSRASVVRLHRCLVAVGGGTSVATLLLLDAQGHSVMRLQAGTWGLSNIEALRSTLQVPIDGSWDTGAPLTYQRLRKAFPGSCPWWLAHVIALSMLTTLAAFAILIVVVVIATGGR